MENASGGHQGQASGQARRNRSMRLHDYTGELFKRERIFWENKLVISRFALLEDNNMQRLIRHTQILCQTLNATRNPQL
jgi:hypothetical protein